MEEMLLMKMRSSNKQYVTAVEHDIQTCTTQINNHVQFPDLFIQFKYFIITSFMLALLHVNND